MSGSVFVIALTTNVVNQEFLGNSITTFSAMENL